MNCPKMKKLLAFALGISLLQFAAQAQLLVPKTTFTRADSLHGNNSPLRACYDINYYHLDVKFDIGQKFISGSNLFKFTAVQDFNKLQLDLFANLKLEKIEYKGKKLRYTREVNAVFVTFPKTITKGSKDEFTVYYSGNPVVARRAPWDGGVVFAKDSLGKPFVATACEGVGAAIWWPNKDQLTDEVDSMMISVSAPNGLKEVSNGRLRKVTDLKNGYTKYDWFVKNPINNYDVEATIGDLVHLSDTYDGEKGKLSLDYWVLSYNAEKAKRQFGLNVKPMLKSFEHWFGPYPWYEDGYKLVEAPHLGMEHQSAVAYGNHYGNGYLGRDLSGTGWGLKWDYIVVHESAHEWFGNNITAKDYADMWVHESFAYYAESLFVESQYGKQAGLEYVNGSRVGSISNDAPIGGLVYGVSKEGSGDMYNKGGVMLNMVRTIINDDEKWRNILRGLNSAFYHKTVTYDDITKYISDQSGVNLTTFFEQYIHTKDLPVLEFGNVRGKFSVRWTSCVRGFTMPVKVRIKGGEYQFISPSTRFTPVNIDGLNEKNLEVDTFNYYVGVMIDN